MTWGRGAARALRPHTKPNEVIEMMDPTKIVYTRWTGPDGRVSAEARIALGVRETYPEEVVPWLEDHDIRHRLRKALYLSAYGEIQAALPTLRALVRDLAGFGMKGCIRQDQLAQVEGAQALALELIDALVAAVTAPLPQAREQDFAPTMMPPPVKTASAWHRSEARRAKGDRHED